MAEASETEVEKSPRLVPENGAPAKATQEPAAAAEDSEDEGVKYPSGLTLVLIIVSLCLSVFLVNAMRPPVPCYTALDANCQ
jgi:hypothetical protein